ncbi:helix-turn-helix transcriptional regulator [Bengtsoniella intestinalis]|uniref:hypothetical protein n=1 Tax=Bengtsoniella intestinalis TaxID=3073143 RepID=UPI00391F429C
MTNLRYLRLKHGLSLKILVRYLPHRHQQVSRFELGQRSPSKPTIQSYQKALEQVISAKKDAISELEQDYLKVKDKLFEEATP